MHPTPDHEAQALLEQLRWMRELAGTLVRDPHAADDLAQEACVAAWRRPPQAGVEPRRWLAGVLRKLVLQRARSAARRAARERAAARREAVDDTADLVARAQFQRQLAEFVLALGEPYRSTLLLRYFEGLSPAQIAVREGLPVATIHSRQQRALALLRQKLDRAHGGERQAWLALALPLTAVGAPPGPAPTTPPKLLPDPSPATFAGTLLMNAKLAVALLVLAGAGAFTYLWPETFQSEPLGLAEELQAPGSLPAGELALRTSEGEFSGSARLELAPNSPVPASGASAAAPTLSAWTVHGRVLDCEARPQAGVRLSISNAATELVADASGQFSFDTTQDSGQVSAVDAGWVTVGRALWRRDADFEPLVLVAPALELSGAVLRQDGQPLAQVRVFVSVPKELPTRFDASFEGTAVASWSTLSDEQGRFSMSAVPAVRDGRLRAVLEGYAAAAIDLPALSTHGLELLLTKPEVPLQGSLRGRVLDLAGRPVEDARVALGVVSRTTDQQGRFSFELASAVTSERLVAVRAGCLPAVLERPGEPSPGDTGWPDYVELRLGAAALSIRGRVLDPKSQPIEGARVWITDVTPFGVLGGLPADMESLMAGARVPPEAFQFELPAEDGENQKTMRMRVQTPDAMWNYSTSDQQGNFEIRGLRDQDYRLRFLLENSLCVETSSPIRAGTQHALVQLHTPDVFPRLVGHVHSEAGTPLAGVLVGSSLDVKRNTGRVFGGTQSLVAFESGPETHTDAQGRFELLGMPRQGAQLTFSGDAIVPRTVPLPEDADVQDFRVSLFQRCEFQLKLEAPHSRADSLEVLDAQGQWLELSIRHGNRATATNLALLADGRSEVISVGAQAKTLVLYKGDDEVARLPLDLRPAQLQELSY